MNPRVRKWVIAILLGSGGAFLGSITFGAAIYYWKEHVHHLEAGALASLEALRAMQENYKTAKGFYVGTFSDLGVPLGAKLSGDALTWDDGYEYRLTELVNRPTGAAIVYAISARPIQYKNGSKKSFLMSQDGTVFVTTENRPANRNDHRMAPTG
jgi:hypothetical protein